MSTVRGCYLLLNANDTERIDITMESCLDIFKIVIGPSSSRTVGPMRAACHFISLLREQETLPLIREIEIELYGALSLSRKCHNVDTALYLGLLGYQPENVDLRSHMAVIKRAEMKTKSSSRSPTRRNHDKSQDYRQSPGASRSSLCHDVSRQR